MYHLKSKYINSWRVKCFLKKIIVRTPHKSLPVARSHPCSFLQLSQVDHCKDLPPVLFVLVYSVVRKCWSYTCSTSGLLHRQICQISPSWSVIMTLRKKKYLYDMYYYSYFWKWYPPVITDFDAFRLHSRSSTKSNQKLCLF